MSHRERLSHSASLALLARTLLELSPFPSNEKHDNVVGLMMFQDLERIEYRSGMLQTGVKIKDLPVKTWRGSQISFEVRAAINEGNLLNLGGVYGTKDAGNPMEYDCLRLVLTDDVVEIEVFNRSSTLSTTDDEKIERIHRVLNMLAIDEDNTSRRSPDA